MTRGEARHGIVSLLCVFCATIDKVDGMLWFDYREVTSLQHITTLSMALTSPVFAGVSRAQAASVGPYLQGVLMECVDGDYAAAVHALPFNPYSQYCCKDGEGDRLIWKVNALTDDAAVRIIDSLARKDSFLIRALDAHCEVSERSIKTIPLKSLTDMVGRKGPEKTYVRFVAPTAFKSGGRYVFMPTTRLILQNLLMHYSQVYEGSKEVDEETISYIEKHVAITSYNLRSQYFTHVMGDRRKVPAFTGSLTLSLNGPQSANGLVRMLLKFGEGAGVGIKTSMGMGGMLCDFRNGNERISERGPDE